MKYIIEYWLPNQSRLFSEPKCVAVDAKELKKYLAIAKEHNYEIENITQVEEA